MVRPHSHLNKLIHWITLAPTLALSRRHPSSPVASRACFRRSNRRHSSWRIYYFHSDNAPLYLLTIFGKGEKVDLTDEERNELAKVIGVLKRRIEGRQ